MFLVIVAAFTPSAKRSRALYFTHFGLSAHRVRQFEGPSSCMRVFEAAAMLSLPDSPIETHPPWRSNPSLRHDVGNTVEKQVLHKWSSRVFYSQGRPWASPGVLNPFPSRQEQLQYLRITFRDRQGSRCQSSIASDNCSVCPTL